MQVRKVLQLKRELSAYLWIVSVCIGVVNSILLVILLVWLCRHPKLRGGCISSRTKKPKTESPKKILTIDYRMSDLDDALERCPQRQGAFMIGQSVPQEGRQPSVQVHHRGDELQLDNPSFTAAPENFADAVYENTSFSPKVT
ncbi:uncharacterized protein LOC110979237 isoform X2 [Acanthaster planci]|uniref:Uncharacterized protein LOC110979237 isoform X2 n=1 Tax=Acanthaster planci TaxID=133434 RepID=A0A8B7YFX7_ACAPL|nr:uncharacterized protein LOC110979237 isoform X2 [Acanthaster planci]